MAKKTVSPMPPAPKSFTLAKKMKAALPEGERAGADAWLWQKSGGLCALCGRPLSPGDAEPDHRIPTDHQGADELSNLYLAHRTCNRSRGNLPFELARPVVEFKAFSDETRSLSFDSVIERYLVQQGKAAKQAIGFRLGTNQITLSCGSAKLEAEVFTDPATTTAFFFTEVPVSHIFNDTEVQPRLLMYSHVRALALDFAQRPVHEPSNCRLVKVSDNTAHLLQFDGQHKTTAQILLGREHIPVKIYVEPDVAMIQALVVKIQQEIKKQPLTKSDTLAKLGDVIKRHMEAYLNSAASPKTEVGFIGAQPKAERKTVTKLYEQELHRLVFFDDDNMLAKKVRPGKDPVPTTDKVVIEKIIAPLLHKKLLDLDMEATGGRDTERELVLLVLNTIANKMLPDKWWAPGNEVAAMRAKTFFYQGSISWWRDELLTALKYVTQRMKADEPLFIGDLDQAKRDHVVSVAEKLCDLDTWSTTDEGILEAMRSNTLTTLRQRLPHDIWKGLIK